MYQYREYIKERLAKQTLDFKSECGRQTCAACPENAEPVTRRMHNNKNHEFVSSGDGCYHIFIGRPAKRVNDEPCDCDED